jgi:hypothetical protein
VWILSASSGTPIGPADRPAGFAATQVVAADFVVIEQPVGIVDAGQRTVLHYRAHRPDAGDAKYAEAARSVAPCPRRA